MGSQLLTLSYNMFLSIVKLWSVALLSSALMWSTCHGQTDECNVLLDRLNVANEGIMLECGDDGDFELCAEFKFEKLYVTGERKLLGCREPRKELSTWNEVRDEFCYAEPLPTGLTPLSVYTPLYDAFVAARDVATLTPIMPIVPWLEGRVSKVIENLWKAHDTYNWFVSVFGRHEESALINYGSKSGVKEEDNLCNDFGMNIWFKSDQYVKKDECSRIDRSRVLDIMDTARTTPGSTARDIAESIERKMKAADIKYHFISVVQTLGHSGQWLRGGDGANSCLVSLPPLLHDAIAAVPPTAYGPGLLGSPEYPATTLMGIDVFIR